MGMGMFEAITKLSTTKGGVAVMIVFILSTLLVSIHVVANDMETLSDLIRVLTGGGQGITPVNRRPY